MRKEKRKKGINELEIKKTEKESKGASYYSQRESINQSRINE
jgi:hypothetical protein